MVRHDARGVWWCNGNGGGGVQGGVEGVKENGVLQSLTKRRVSTVSLCWCSCKNQAESMVLAGAVGSTAAAGDATM